MKHTILFALCTIALFAQGQAIKWPHHKRYAIVLTYDDALPSQLNIAASQLEAAHLTGTFFLTSDIDSLSIPRWRRLAKKGFELGNHTIFHPCSGTEDNPVSSDHYTAYQIIREIEVMDRFLYAIDGKTKRTYAYPCAETTVGGKDYVDSLRKYTLVKYARVGGDMSNAVIADFTHLDRLRIPSYGLDGDETSTQLIAFVKKVQQSGGLGIIMIHGVGGDYITISKESHQQLINYLKANKNDIWVNTFQKTMDYVSNYLKTSRSVSAK